MLKRRAFLLLGSAASFVGAREAHALFSPIGIAGLANRQVPTITSMVPNNGPALGGTAVSFIGCSFSGITGVSFGGVPANNVVVTSNDVMTCTAPPHLNGPVNVVLTNPVGPSSPIVFTYGSLPVVSTISPPNGPTAGGTVVTITGSNFTGVTGVTIGAPATSVTPSVTNPDGSLTCTTAPGSASTVNVVVTNGVGSGTLASAFTYQGGAFSQSIPLGSFTPIQVNGGFAEANGDGTTGYNSGGNGGGGWTVLNYNGVIFPADGFYNFVIPAWCSSFPGIPGNSIAVYIDQLPIPSNAGNTTNLNWFYQFVSNVQLPGTPSNTNYSWTAPITAGWHQIQIYMNNAAYYGLPLTGNRNTHCDRLNITSTGAGLPAEPSPATRDPSQSPMSSYHFINVPFGANATWLPLSSPIAQTVNGGNGNGANVHISALSFGDPVWIGQSTDPVISVTVNDILNYPAPITGMSYPVKGPAGLFPAFGSDGANQMIDSANPRYTYGGFGQGSRLIGRTYSFGTLLVQDSYNLNSAAPQSALGGFGLIRVSDLDSGAIRHRLVGGLAGAVSGNNFISSTTIGYGHAQQTSKWSGQPWPSCESDHDWASPAPGRYSNSNGPPYGSVIGIPPTVAKPSGLNPATSMAWDCMQNYGCYLNVFAGSGNSPTVTMYAESAAEGHPTLTAINWSQIVPSLSVLTNPAPIILGANPPTTVQGFGGGALRPGTALLPGQQQSLPARTAPPYTPPASPPGVPINLDAFQGLGGGIPGGTAFGNAAVASTIPTNSFVVVFYAFDRASSTTAFTSTFNDSRGNTYTFIQPPTGSLANHVAMAVCLSTTQTIVNGVNWAPNMTPGGQVNYWLLGAYFLPPPTTGSFSLRASNSAITGSSVTSLSTTLAGVQTGDLVLCAAMGTNYTEIQNPTPGWSSLLPFPPVNFSFKYATAAGTVTCNPTWNFATPASMVAAAFVVGSGGGGTAPTISTVNDTGTNTPNGSTGGNRPITISGSNFTGATSVTFGGVAAIGMSVVNAGTITCRSPPHAAGAVSVVVTHPTNGSNGANTAYTYRLVDGAGTALTLPTNGGASATWGFSTLSFQEEFNDLLSVQINATGSLPTAGYVTPVQGYNFYTQHYGWLNDHLTGSFTAQWSGPQQFYLSQYFSVTSSVLRMVGHTTGPDTLAALVSTAFITGGAGFVGTTINSANGWYIETRAASSDTPNGNNGVWAFDNRSLIQPVPSGYTEVDFAEMHFTGVGGLDQQVLQYDSSGNFQNGPLVASGFNLDTAFHVYGTLFVPGSRPGGGFLRFFIDGNLISSTSIPIPNGSVGATLAAALLQINLLTDSNSNTAPLLVDYVRVWQQTPIG